MENNFTIGDEIYHKARPGIKWVVENIDTDILICTTINKDTFETITQRFPYTSIVKIKETPPLIISKRRNNFW